jgi:hypothetical protein
MTILLSSGANTDIPRIRLPSVPQTSSPGSLLPTFDPAYPCALENVEVYVEDTCQVERVTEQRRFSGDETMILERVAYFGRGCQASTSYSQYSLQSCHLTTGERTPLLDSEGAFVFYPSADGQVLVFSTFNWTPDVSPDSQLYRINADGSGLQLLSTQALPEPYISAVAQGWIDADWMLAYLWDGRQTQAYRFRVDGSGAYEPLGAVGTPLPIWTP